MENQSLPRRNPTENFMTITDLWRLCLANWRWFVVSLTVCLGAALYYLAITPKMYTREAAVLVKEETKGNNASNRNGDEFNDLGMLKQTTNLNNVVRHMTSLDILMEVAKRIKKGFDEKETLRQAQRYQKRLKAEIDNDKSTIINLTFDDYSPESAEEVLYAIVQVYNEKWLKDKQSITESTSKFIDARLAVLERDLNGVDDSISIFKSVNRITDLSSVSDMYLQQQSQADAEILRISNEKSMAQYIRGMLEDKSAQHQLLPVNSGINNSVAEAQITNYNNMLMQLNSHLIYTSEQNPLIVNQEKELSTLRKNIMSTIDNQIQTLNIQLGSLRGYSGAASSKIASNPSQEKHLTAVEREQKVKESLYLYLLQKREENEISMTYNALNTQMIDIPHGGDEPTFPNSRNILFAATLLALMIPVIVLFVRESLDDTVKDRTDLEHISSLSLIGEVPMADFNQEKKLISLKRKHKKDSIVVASDRQDYINESFRVIRNNLEFMTGKNAGENNVYMVTSSYAGSGKTFVSVNLALSLAIREKRVLFIDGDLRLASASKQWGYYHKGLSDYLSGRETNIPDIIYKHSKYSSLDILPVGTVPPNPTELLSCSLLPELISYVRKSYDFVIIDCPPSENLADADIIGRYVDRTLFVVRTGLFERKRLSDLEYIYQTGKYKHMSVILNCIEMRGQYGYYKYSKYGYSYRDRGKHR